MTHLRSPQARIPQSRGWRITSEQGSARALHDRQIGHAPQHAIWLNQLRGPALVLGSSQADDVIDAKRAENEGFEVCRRRSGGGLVVVRPELDTWIDVVIPSESMLWSNDVGQAFYWLGDVWAATLQALLPGRGVSVHRGPLRGGRGGKLVCFASLGPGEVTIEGQKVVGISQRRTANGARFQCVVTWRWYPELLRHFLAASQMASVDLDPDEVAAGLDLTDPPSSAALTSTFVDRLPPVD